MTWGCGPRQWLGRVSERIHWRPRRHSRSSDLSDRRSNVRISHPIHVQSSILPVEGFGDEESGQSLPPSPVDENRIAESSSVDALLQTHGYSPYFAYGKPRTIDEALCWAASAGHEAAVEDLLARGAAVYKGEGQWLEIPALHRAIMGRQEQTATRLIEARPDAVNMPGPQREAPMILAARCGTMHVLPELVRWGAQVNCRNYWGRTPLHEAVSAGHLPAVAYLIDQGAAIFAADDGGNTPYELACMHSAGDPTMRAMAGLLRRAAFARRSRDAAGFERTSAGLEDEADDSLAPDAFLDLPVQVLRRPPGPPPPPTPPSPPPLLTHTVLTPPPPTPPSPTPPAIPGEIKVREDRATYASGGDWDDGFSAFEYGFVPDAASLASSAGSAPSMPTMGDAMHEEAQVREGEVEGKAVKEASTGLHLSTGSSGGSTDWDDEFPVVAYRIVEGTGNGAGPKGRTVEKTGHIYPEVVRVVQDSGLRSPSSRAVVEGVEGVDGEGNGMQGEPGVPAAGLEHM